VHFLREEPEHHNTSAHHLKAEGSAEYKKVNEANGKFKKDPLNPRVPDRVVCIGTEANQQEQMELLPFLNKKNDVFAWSTSNLVRVSRDIIEHWLQVNPSAKPKKQKLQKMLEEKIVSSKAEVQQMLDVGFIREVTYPQWLANVVMVKKKNGK
jgi:hypothetical protein